MSTLHTPTPWRVVGSIWRSRGTHANIRVCGSEVPANVLIISGVARNADELARFRADVQLILFAVNKLAQMRTVVTRLRTLYDELRAI